MKCSYCGEEEQRTSGKLLVLKSGDREFFCSGKCEKNWKNDRGHEYAD
ncbi:MAG: 50S ribosomal protein L24e [Candidatus Nanohaloarchaea archaeon]